jgi:hypothetical protein
MAEDVLLNSVVSAPALRHSRRETALPRRLLRHWFAALVLTSIATAQAPIKPPSAVPPAPAPPGATPPRTTPPAAIPPRTAPPATAPAAAAAPKSDAEKLQKRMKNRKLMDEFFAGPIVRLEIDFEPKEWEALAKQNREYAEGTITEIGPDLKKIVHKNAAIKLKGSAGSFQTPDKRPGLTVNMTKLKGGDRFHGMKKFHLNNGVQDGSLLNEFISGEMCRAAQVPASRCTHVALKWQGREMGIYVFKESFNEDFFSYFYERTDGSLYDGHFISEIDGNMEKQEGDPADTKDIKGLVEACKEADEKVRWQKLSERLDVPEFLRFLAMETFTSHWDGYNFNQNNYRVYFDAKTGKGNFFAHGMDQTWGLTNWSVLRDPISMVGGAVLGNPAWRAQYRKTCDELYARVLNIREWDNRLQRQGRKVEDAKRKWESPQAAKDFAAQITNMRDRLKGRLEAIGKMFPQPLNSNGTIIPLAPRGWHSDGNGTLDEVTADGQKAFHIAADGKGPGAWKLGLILPKGTYKLQAKVKVTNVSGTPAGGREVPKFGPTGEGAGLRISGASRVGKCELKGTAAWQPLTFDFDTPGGEVIFMAELCAGAGETWFSRNTLTLTKVR